MFPPPVQSQRTSPEPRPGWRLSRAELLGIFAFWTLLAILTAGNRLLDPRRPALQTGSPWGPIAMAFAEAYLWALLTPLLFWLAGRFGPERERWPRRVLLLLGAALLLAIGVDVALDVFRLHLLPRPPWRRFDVSPGRGILRLWFLDDLMVCFAVLAAGIAREYFRRYQARYEQTVQLQAQLAEARLQALRMQVNPHFLFNTLHAVSTLVERDPRGVRRMIARLSELLRYTLEGASAQEVPLHQELKFLEGYLDIMRVRFGGQLEVEMEVAPELLNALVPNLVLQPLVENAIEHGASRSEGIGRVDLRAERRGERLHLSVRDNGPRSANEPVREGVGLGNTRARLEQLYGSAQELTVFPAEGEGLVAEISLPFHTGAALRTAVAE